MRDLKERVAVITGGASGIGLALAERLGREGMRLVLADIEQQALDSACGRLTAAGHRVIGMRTDVARWDDMQALAAKVHDTFGQAHVVCNNAGVSILGPTWDLAIDDWRWVLDVNLWGVIHGIKAFLPSMRASGQPGHIVNIASLAAMFPIGTHAPYCASKAAVASISEALHSELRAENAPIGVSAVCPGMVDTRIHLSWRNRPQDDRPWSDREQMTAWRDAASEVQEAGIRPEVVADLILAAIRDDRFWVLTHPAANPGIVERARMLVDGQPPRVWMADQAFRS